MPPQEPNHVLDTLARLEYWRQPPVDNPKRQFRRYMIRGDATLEPLEEQTIESPVIHVMLRDVSRTGVGFLCDTLLQRYSFWRVKFRLQHYQMGTQAVMIRYCRQVRGGLFLVGAQSVMEPYLLGLLGVPEQELNAKPDGPHNEQTFEDFVTPEFIENTHEA